MNILFLTLGRMDSLATQTVYTDLLRALRDRGNSIYTLSVLERRRGLPTTLHEEQGVTMLQVLTGNLTQCGPVEKGISTLGLPSRLKRAIKRHFKGVRFDLVLYSTPPVTFAGVVEYVKRRDGAASYLLLKDIFPQNALDLGMLSTRGPKGLLYRYFRRKEKLLYALSDRIGCMSPANLRYLLAHNPELDAASVQICPNCITPVPLVKNNAERCEMRRQYDLPQDKVIFVYGGNLGKPQGVPSLLDALRAAGGLDRAFFLVVGDGTERGLLEAVGESGTLPRFKLMKSLPPAEYARLVSACDVGLIFLDHRFTIPNFPSRLLSYLQAGLPVLCATDSVTDVGEVAVQGGFGWSCASNDPAAFAHTVQLALEADRAAMGEAAYDYLCAHYTAAQGAEIILNALLTGKEADGK